MSWHILLASGPDGWTVLSRVADVLGVVAFAVVVLGLLSSFLSRPRALIRVNVIGTAAVVSLIHNKGSSPLRDPALDWATLRADGRGMSGDGGDRLTDALVLGDSFLVTVYDAKRFHPPGLPASASERRIPGPEPIGFLLRFTWQRPLIPWLRVERVVYWSSKARMAGVEPKVYSGQLARSVWERSQLPI